MTINDNKTISEIQGEFTNKFPFLKLEFYKTHHDSHKGSPKADKLDSSLKIGDIRNRTHSGDLSINGHLKVETLEERFDEEYGLNVQVFRRSGDLWLQTTATDDWSLTEQNDRGRDSLKTQDLNF